MRSRLRIFALVGLVATAVDLLVFVSLLDYGVVRADFLALLSAALVSYGLNRQLTFRGQQNARWVRNPLVFAGTAAAAGLLDLVVVVFLTDTAGAWLGKALGIAVAATVRWGVYRWILFGVVRRELAERHDRGPAPGEVRLSVVVPAYNEEQGIVATIEALHQELDPMVGPEDLEILVVDDGSTDATSQAAAAAGATVITQVHNSGKGAAVRAGVLGAKGRSIVFTDADLAYPPEMVGVLLAEIEAGWDVVVGSRRHEETTTLVRARKLRELGGRVINWLTHLVLLGHFRDTQCGIKGFRGEIGKAIFERTTIDGFGFDVEIFLIVEQDQLSLAEVPVSVENRAGSSVRLVSDTLILLRDLIRVRRMAGWGRYRPDPGQQLIVQGSRSIGTGHSGADWAANHGDRRSNQNPWPDEQEYVARQREDS